MARAITPGVFPFSIPVKGGQPIQGMRKGAFPPGNRRDAMTENKNYRTQTTNSERNKIYSIFPGIWLTFQDVGT